MTPNQAWLPRAVMPEYQPLFLLIVLQTLQKAGDAIFSIAPVIILYAMFMGGPLDGSTDTLDLHLLSLAFKCLGFLLDGQAADAIYLYFAAIVFAFAILGFQSRHTDSLAVAYYYTIMAFLITGLLSVGLPRTFLPEHFFTNVSHFLFAIESTPQLVALYTAKRRNQWLVLYVSIVAGAKAMCITQSIQVHVDAWSWIQDPYRAIEIVTTVVHTTIWVGFMLAIALKRPVIGARLPDDEEKREAFPKFALTVY